MNCWNSIFSFLLIFDLFCACQYSNAQTKTWINSSLDGDWNNPVNWTPPGTPLSTDVVYFSASSSNYDAKLSASISLAGLYITDFTGTIDLDGNDVSIFGEVEITSGSIFSSIGAPFLIIFNSGTTRFENTSLEVITYSLSSDVYLSGNEFIESVYFSKSGNADNYSAGDNIFYTNSVLEISGAGNLIMGNLSGDTFEDLIDLNNYGTGTLWLGYSGTSNFSSTISIDNAVGNIHFGNATSQINFNPGANIKISNFTGGTLTLQSIQDFNTDLMDLILTDGATLNIKSCIFNRPIQIESPRFFTSFSRFRNSLSVEKTGDLDDASLGGNQYDGDLSITNSSNYFILFGANAATPPDVYNGQVTLNNYGSLSRIFMSGYSSGNVFNGPVIVNQESTGGGGYIRFSEFSSSSSTFNNSISVNCTSGAGVYLGNAGSVTLNPGAIVNIGSTGFETGTLRLRNVSQFGSASTYNLSLTGSSTLNFINTIWNAPVIVETPILLLEGNSFNNSSSFKTTGTINSYCPGANTFNSNVTFENAGTARLRLAYDPGKPDDFNGNLTLIKSNTGFLQPCYNSDCTIAGDIIINTNSSSPAFGFSELSGTTILDGSTNQNFVRLDGTSNIPSFRNLEINKSGGTASLGFRLQILDFLSLVNGIIETNSFDVTIENGANSSTGNNGSFIEGTVAKRGNIPGDFTFPTGDAGIWAPVSISILTGGTSSNLFAASYHYQEPVDMANLDAAINHVSSLEYWTLNRLSGTATGDVTFFWKDANQSDIDVLSSDLIISKYSGTGPWQNIGGSITPGSSIGAGGEGGITANVTSFSTFTFGKATGITGLPVNEIELSTNKLGSQISLDWKTNPTSIYIAYEIQKSLNGSEFQTFAEVTPVNGKSSYSYMHLDEVPGQAYFRILGISDGNKQKFSNVLFLSNSGKFDFHIIKSESIYSLILENFNGRNLAMKIVDQTGREVYTKQFNDPEIRIELPTLISNLYIVTLTGDGVFRSKKILIIR
ncbi:MAG TPA: hypothetical protein VGA21_03235 [Cyclobacteriaceae bacterium]